MVPGCPSVTLQWVYSSCKMGIVFQLQKQDNTAACYYVRIINCSLLLPVMVCFSAKVMSSYIPLCVTAGIIAVMLIEIPLFSQVPSFPPSSCWCSWHMKTCYISLTKLNVCWLLECTRVFVCHGKVWYHYGWTLSIFYKLMFYRRLKERNAQWNEYENSDLLIFVGLFLIIYILIY